MKQYGHFYTSWHVIIKRSLRYICTLECVILLFQLQLFPYSCLQAATLVPICPFAASGPILFQHVLSERNELAIVSRDSTVRLFNAIDGQLKWIASASSDDAFGIVHGKHHVYVYSANLIEGFHTDTGRLAWRRKGSYTTVTASPDCAYLLAAGPKTLSIIETDTGCIKKTIDFDQQLDIRFLMITDYAQAILISVVNGGSNLHRIDLDRCELTAPLKRVADCPSAAVLVSGSLFIAFERGDVRKLDAVTFADIAAIDTTYAAPVMSIISLSNRILLAFADGRLLFVEQATLKQSSNLKLMAPLLSLEVVNTNQLMVSHGGPSLRRYSTSGEQLLDLSRPSGLLTAVSMSKEKGRLVTATTDCQLIVWTIGDAINRTITTLVPTQVIHLRILPPGNIASVVLDDGQLFLFNLATGQLSKKADMTRSLDMAVCSNDIFAGLVRKQKMLLITNWTEESPQRIVRNVPLRFDCGALGIDKSHNVVAVSKVGNELMVAGLMKNVTTRTVSVSKGLITPRFSVSPDCTRFVYFTERGSFQLWDLEIDRMIAEIEPVSPFGVSGWRGDSNCVLVRVDKGTVAEVSRDGMFMRSYSDTVLYPEYSEDRGSVLFWNVDGSMSIQSASQDE